MENPIVPKEVTSIQHATAEEIYEVSERVIDMNSDVTRAAEALDVLSTSLVNFEKSVKDYNSKKSTVRAKMQRLSTIM